MSGANQISAALFFCARLKTFLFNNSLNEWRENMKKRNRIRVQNAVSAAYVKFMFIYNLRRRCRRRHVFPSHCIVGFPPFFSSSFTCSFVHVHFLLNGL